MERLAGRTAVLTGAAHGIGRATALALARAGANVVVADIDLEQADEVAREIGESALAVRCDVTSEDDFAKLRDAALERFGRVEIVVNTVGVLYSGWPTELSLEIWREVVDTNLLSCVRAYHAFAPILLEQGEGQLVLTASAAGTYAYAYDRLPYASTKAAVISLAEGLALYLRPRGVGVTCLVPGSVATTMLDRMRFVGDDPPQLRSAAFSGLLDPNAVGELVVDAIRTDTFWLLTHPEVQESLVQRAQDPEAFVERQTARIAQAEDEKDGPFGKLAG